MWKLFGMFWLVNKFRLVQYNVPKVFTSSLEIGSSSKVDWHYQKAEISLQGQVFSHVKETSG